MQPDNRLDDRGLEQAITVAGLAGAVAMVADRDGVTYARAFGEKAVGSGNSMTVDTPFQIASMTKAIVSVAAMQLVERGRLSLDAPIGSLLPELADPRVLAGFDPDGTPQLRPAARPVTLRHLLTHTSGLGYAFVQPELGPYFAATGMPAPGSRAGIDLPLLFDPGDEWAYGVSTDWVGLAIEAATGERLGDVLAASLFEPLGMTGSGFHDALPPQAAKGHVRAGDSLAPFDMFIGGGEFQSGGGGLVSTAPDYARFLRMLLRGGELDGARVLSAETVAEMGRNQVGTLRAGAMASTMPALALPFDPIPDQHTGWGLGFLINPEPGPHGRSPGSLAWAGVFNSFYWLDPAAGVAGILMAQLSPFGDPGALAAYAALERMAYRLPAAEN